LHTLKREKRDLSLLIGAWVDDALAIALQEYLNLDLSDRYNLSFKISENAKEILDFSRDNNVDIYILVLNNIDSLEGDIMDRQKNALNLCSEIQLKYAKPIIALSGFHEETFVKKAQLVSNFFLFNACGI